MELFTLLPTAFCSNRKTLCKPIRGGEQVAHASPTGRCRMWDASADRYGRGEGIACVVPKTLTQAQKDGDHIECLIRETGVNQDGRTSGITMPNNIAQTSLIRDTYGRAGLDLSNPMDRPQFFHAHGTGTKAGDPQEAGRMQWPLDSNLQY